MTELLPQPHGIEGLAPVAEVLHPYDPAPRAVKIW
jgi:hypothetical protein